MAANEPDATQVASAPPRAKQRRMAAPARRERILDAALPAFAEEGFTASLTAIAQTAGITRSVFYYYFPSRDDLVFAVMERQVAAIFGALGPATMTRGSLDERCGAIVDALLTFARENPTEWVVLVRGLDDSNPALADARDRAHDVIIAAAEGLFGADLAGVGVEVGTVRARIIGEVLITGILAAVRWWLQHPEVPAEVMRSTVVELALRGAGGSMTDA